MIIGLAAVVLIAGLLARTGTMLRNRNPHRETRDRRARTIPRVRAEGVPAHGGNPVVVDDDPSLD